MARGKQAIAGFTAGKTVTFGGTTYTAGQTIPTAVVGGLKRASALISKRLIVPTSLPYPKKSATGARLRKPTPVALSPKERRNLGA